MSKPWDRLPNAAHINAVLESVNTYPDEWTVSWNTNWNKNPTMVHKSWREAFNIVQHDITIGLNLWTTIHNNIFHLSGPSFRTSRNALLALTAFDNCAYMLESAPRELEMLARFGDPRAVLLLPACKALALIKEKELLTTSGG